MILVDSSVWIDLLNNVVTEPVRRLRELIPTTPVLLRGCRSALGLRVASPPRAGAVEVLR